MLLPTQNLWKGLAIPQKVSPDLQTHKRCSQTNGKEPNSRNNPNAHQLKGSQRMPPHPFNFIKQ